MPASDFDFLNGRFRVHHSRLLRRLEACQEWTEFETELWGRRAMGGHAFIDEMHGILDGRDFWGMTVRLLDPATDEWSLYWADSWQSGMRPPMRGRFENGEGVFLGPEQEAGTPVLARFVWSEISAGGAKWEQAFSIDEGRTREANWIMRFTRTGPAV